MGTINAHNAIPVLNQNNHTTFHKLTRDLLSIDMNTTQIIALSLTILSAILVLVGAGYTANGVSKAEEGLGPSSGPGWCYDKDELTIVTAVCVVGTLGHLIATVLYLRPQNQQ